MKPYDSKTKEDIYKSSMKGHPNQAWRSKVKLKCKEDDISRNQYANEDLTEFNPDTELHLFISLCLTLVSQKLQRLLHRQM